MLKQSGLLKFIRIASVRFCFGTSEHATGLKQSGLVEPSFTNEQDVTGAAGSCSFAPVDFCKNSVRTSPFVQVIEQENSFSD